MKMKCWIARDGFGGTLALFSYKPYRPYEGLGLWHMRKGGVFQLPKEMFPELKWEHEPMMVEVTITPIK